MAWKCSVSPASTRFELSKKTAFLGVAIGVMVGTATFVPTAMLLDLTLTPPLIPPANYGQAGMGAIVPAIYLGISGACFGLILYIRRTGVYICQLAQLSIAYFGKLALLPNEPWGSVWIVTLLCLFCLPLLAIPFVDLWAQSLFRSAQQITPSEPPVVTKALSIRSRSQSAPDRSHID